MGLQQALPEFKKLGAEVYAITADSYENTVKAIGQWKLSFLVTLDPDGDTLREYGVLDPTSRRAVPSTFVIDRQGIVRYRHLGKSAKDRPDLREVLEAVQKIAGAAKP